VTFNTGTGLIDNANAGQSISIDNSLGGAGGIQLNGNSTLTLTTINTYTGATTINPAATLALSGLGGIPFSSVVTANGTFDISGSTIPFKAISTLAGSGFVQLGNNGLVITAGSTEFSGTIAGTGSGGIEIAGGTQTLSGVNTYAGVTQIDSGATLALKGNGSIANTLYVGFLGAGTLDISQTKSGASVSGLFDPVGFGKVSLGSKTLTFTGSAGFFNGVIQDGGIGGGTGGNVTIANGGIATLGGVNTYTGLTTINAGGELDMSGNGSIAASKAVINNGIFDISCLCSSSGSITSLSGASTGIVNLGANTLTITNGSGTYAGAILDGGLGGGFAITGGKEVLTGASSYTGATTITGATLEVDGSISGTSGVTVNSGGMLSGTGTIDPPTVTINSGATLAPGNTANPFGALTITGTLLFNAGSFYAINVAPGAGNNSKTAVVGSATLGGNGTVVVTPQLGHYSGAVYQILTTTTGLTGTFAGLTVNGNFVGSLKLDYATNPGDVDLNISGASLLTTPPGANQNQRNVIGGINNGILNSPANAPLPAQFLSLGNLSGPSPLNALTQLDGEAGTGAERAAFQLTDQFLTLMLDPFVDGRQGRLGSGGGGAIGFAPEQQENLPPDIALAYAAILKKAPPPTFDQRWTAWGTAFGGSNRANGDAVIGSTNVTAQTFGFAAGMDYHVSPNTVGGFALAGAGTNWGLASALGTDEATRRRSVLTPSRIGGRPTSPVRSPSPTTGLRAIAPRWALRFQPTSSARAMGRG
jgi:autotransporter-associated beta strand protein